MLKQQAAIFSKITILADTLVIILSFLMAYYLRLRWGALDDLLDYFWILLIIIPVWNFLFSRFDLYTSFRTTTPTEIFLALLKAQFFGGVFTSAAIYMIDPNESNRGLMGGFIAISFIAFVIEKLALKTGLGCIRTLGFNYRNILIVGTEDRAREFIALVKKHGQWGLKIVGLLQTEDDSRLCNICGYEVFGNLNALAETCKSRPVDEVIFCLPMNSLVNIDEYLHDLEEMGMTVRMVLDLHDLRRAKRELSLFHGQVPMLSFSYRNFDAGQLLLKRFLDILGSVVGLCITALFFPFIAVAIKLDSPGPLFFGQQRMGKNGRLFKCWKFRSMYIDAEERKKELAHLNEMKGAIFKIKDDPRITGVGGFLRKTSLDELPQFWNVFKGEMSLVGTRPPTPDEVEKYENWHRRRISIKPGITGLWQVSGRNQITNFDEIVHLDLNYIDKWSLQLDLMIMFQTVWVVMARRGSS